MASATCRRGSIRDSFAWTCDPLFHIVTSYLKGCNAVRKSRAVRKTRICAECGCEFSSSRPRAACSSVCAFWRLVDKSAGPDACWPWIGHVTPSTGYGDVPARYNSGTRITAHRHAWKLHNLCDPDKLFVLHRCDNRVCCNPAHLFIGTARVNAFDAGSKGRPFACAPGEGHPKAKLSEAIVRHIRSCLDDADMLAERYGVSPGTVRAARRGETWRHLPLA
jgi:hypothetical protein